MHVNSRGEKIVLLQLQGVSGKDGNPGPAGEKGDKVRLMINILLYCYYLRHGFKKTTL